MKFCNYRLDYSGVSPDLKKHNYDESSDPLTSIPEVDPDTREMIMNCVADCFKDEEFIKKITPTIVTLTQHVNKVTINDAVTKAVTKLEQDVIKPLQKKADVLTKAIDEKDRTIKEKDDIITTKDELLNQRADEIESLERRVDSLENKLDNLEQYGRRSSVRMCQTCSNAALKVINELLKIPMVEDDIERCHSVEQMPKGIAH